MALPFGSRGEDGDGQKAGQLSESGLQLCFVYYRP